MVDPETNDLRGRTLKVYLYVIKEKGPIGPRDVMRKLEFSSPSVAYRHLQKLETMGLIKKDNYGNYHAKEKVSIRGFMWVGRRLVPNAIVYSLIFLVLLIWELVVFVLHFSVETSQFKIFFFLLMAITILASVLFMLEGLRSQKRSKIDQSKSP